MNIILPLFFLRDCSLPEYFLRVLLFQSGRSGLSSPDLPLFSGLDMDVVFTDTGNQDNGEIQIPLRVPIGLEVGPKQSM